MKLKSWVAALMMIFSIIVVCVLVPAGFILSGSFTTWLKGTGVHSNPNLAGGYPVAEFEIGSPVIAMLPPGGNLQEVQSALSLRRFEIKKVAFRRWSGIGIAPRLNLCFEFEGRLPDPHNSSHKFSMTVIHVYVKAPRKAADPVSSAKAARIDFSDMDWNYQVIVDGLHEQARVFDPRGNLIAQGLGLYVEHQEGSNGKPENKSVKTRITAALPLELLGDPSLGEWRYSILVGLADSLDPSLMLHSGEGGSLKAYNGTFAERGQSAPGGKPKLRPLPVSNRI